MKHAVWIFLALYSAAAIVACGGNNNENDVPDVAANVGCPAGTVLHLGYCVNQQTGQPVNTGSIAFQAGTYNSQGTLKITNRSTYEKLLQEGMAVCNQSAYNSGLSACSSFNYAMITLQAVNTQMNAVRMTIEAWPTSSPNGYYNVSLPSWSQFATCAVTSYFFGGCMMMPNQYQAQVTRNPLALNMALSNINNSQGLEARGYGGAGTISQTKLIQLIIPVGKLTDAYLDYQLAYNGQAGGIFATGRLVRCNNATCGLMGY
jgi:hypothetical protein